VEKKLSTLSMGERARVAFAKLILSGANVLLLDEVTNFLDLNSREKIQEALEAFAGSLLFVSHDRYFIDGLARKVAVLECSGLRIYDGNYSYYLEKSRQEQSQSADYRGLEAEINRLECRLAYLGGRLASCAVEEKERLDREFGEAALKLRECKAKLSK
jgi:ATPase subunit of ABC transporter with duplicated ATPase domains